jgi:hypothetical protein
VQVLAKREMPVIHGSGPLSLRRDVGSSTPSPGRDSGGSSMSWGDVQKPLQHEVLGPGVQGENPSELQQHFKPLVPA